MGKSLMKKKMFSGNSNIFLNDMLEKAKYNKFLKKF